MADKIFSKKFKLVTRCVTVFGLTFLFYACGAQLTKQEATATQSSDSHEGDSQQNLEKQQMAALEQAQQLANIHQSDAKTAGTAAVSISATEKGFEAINLPAISIDGKLFAYRSVSEDMSMGTYNDAVLIGNVGTGNVREEFVLVEEGDIYARMQDAQSASEEIAKVNQYLQGIKWMATTKYSSNGEKDKSCDEEDDTPECYTFHFDIPGLNAQFAGTTRSINGQKFENPQIVKPAYCNADDEEHRYNEKECEKMASDNWTWCSGLLPYVYTAYVQEELKMALFHLTYPENEDGAECAYNTSEGMLPVSY